MMSAKLMSCGRRERRNPPRAPRVLINKLRRLRSERICSRNARGTLARLAMSVTDNGCKPRSPASAIIAFKAYLARCDSIRFPATREPDYRAGTSVATASPALDLALAELRLSPLEQFDVAAERHIARIDQCAGGRAINRGRRRASNFLCPRPLHRR